MNLGSLCTVITCWVITQAAADEPPPVTWETIEARMQWEAERGFSGVVLVARDGKVAFHMAYGMANREKKISMRTDSILAIGSTPIDFTKAGILLLADRGKLELSDPINRFFESVPQDKVGITIEHLMTGRSGLENFHDLPSDRDKDHSWIDRTEAIRRILNHKLLFAPGRGRRHSHSAWGLLAAIIEIVSRQTYQDFTRERLFQPAGMQDTGFFGEPCDEQRMVVGYGPERDGAVNAPPYWGKTSWLVMGSGGQVSTALDMWRWVQAIYGGKLLSPESAKRYGDGQGVLAGGDMYGFEILYAGNHQHCMIVMCNSGSPRRMQQWRDLGGALASLVLSQRKPPRFTLGVKLDVDDDDRITVLSVVPGGPAAIAGIRPGDILVKIGGNVLGDEPMAALNAALDTGEPIVIELERNGQHKTVTVKPAPR
jgi:CubicO group peptidase (beta-lactamase class C family)